MNDRGEPENRGPKGPPADFELWVDGRKFPGAGGFLVAGVLVLAIVLWDLPKHLANPDPHALATIAVALCGCLPVVIGGLFLSQSREQLLVSRPQRRVVSALVWGSWVVRRVEIDFDDIQQIAPGMPKILRFLTLGLGRQPVVVVQRRGATRLLTLDNLGEAEAVAERLRRAVGIQ